MAARDGIRLKLTKRQLFVVTAALRFLADNEDAANGHMEGEPMNDTDNLLRVHDPGSGETRWGTKIDEGEADDLFAKLLPLVPE